MTHDAWQVSLLDPHTSHLRTLFLGEFEQFKWRDCFRDRCLCELRINSSKIDPTDIPVGTAIEVRRNGKFEFGGYLWTRQIAEDEDANPGDWNLGGPGFTWWLDNRVVVPGGGDDTYDLLATNGETAIRDLITDQLLTPVVDAANRTIEVSSALEPVPATLRGDTVNLQFRYGKLMDAVKLAAERAGLGFRAVLTDDRVLEWQVYSEVDRGGDSSDPFTFSDRIGNLWKIGMQEQRTSQKNQVYTLGVGEGDARVRREVINSDEIASHFRREDVVDAQNIDNNDALDAFGANHLVQQLEGAERYDIVPNSTDLTAIGYKTDWDVGTIVRIRYSTPDKEGNFLIQAKSFVLAGEPLQAELRIELGSPRPQGFALGVQKVFERTEQTRFR